MSSLVGAGIATASGAARPTLLKPMSATGWAPAVPQNSAATANAAARRHSVGEVKPCELIFGIGGLLGSRHTLPQAVAPAQARLASRIHGYRVDPA